MTSEKGKKKSETCEQCGGRIVQIGERDGMRIMKHVSKRKARECLKIDLQKIRAENTERIMKAVYGEEGK